MRTLFLLSITLAVCAAGGSIPLPVKLGASVELKLANEPVKYLTRHLMNGEVQKFHLDGPNKNSWVDKNGKKVDSSNFKFKPPATLVIGKMGKADEGTYDYEPLTTPPPIQPDFGEHYDPVIRGYYVQIE